MVLRNYTRIDAFERNTAREAGHVQYEGRLCPVNPRHGRRCYTSTGGCVECQREADRRKRASRVTVPAIERNRELRPATRDEALALHTLYYFTGKPCRHGHIANRFTSTGACADCLAGRPRRPAPTSTPAPRVDPNAALLTWFYYPMPRPLGLRAFEFCQGLDVARGVEPFPFVETCLRKPTAAERRYAPHHVAFALCGWFRYPLQAGDHAAALAHCQALDIAAGRIPYKP